MKHIITGQVGTAGNVASTDKIRQELVLEFRQYFGASPAIIVRSPGRVNLIGEHTDYNDGFVFPMAIDRASWIALRPRHDQFVFLHSLDHGKTLKFDLDMFHRDIMSWEEYPKGVAHILQQAGHQLHGWEGVTRCDVPMGAGLSSSASFELATARAFSEVSGFAWDGRFMALACQKAENEWVGVNCGIMDQLISSLGKEGHALFIDCRSLDAKPAALPQHTSVMILDTSTRRGLVGTAYNERRAQCAVAANHFGVSALRDVPIATFDARAGELDELIRKRARHVIHENQRTLDALHAMNEGDAHALGILMNESHASLRDDFEVTNDALNVIVETVLGQTGCFGARMTGAGFGGCAVALVETARAGDISQHVATEYACKTGLTPTLYVTTPAGGTSRETLS